MHNTLGRLFPVYDLISKTECQKVRLIFSRPFFFFCRRTIYCRTGCARRGRSDHVLTGGCNGGSQVLLAFTLSSFTFVHHLYHIYHLFSLLTGPLCMLNAYRITPTITISYSSAPATTFFVLMTQFICPVCSCLSQQSFLF
jgi:hypothetical protein